MFVENTICNLLKVPRARFLGSDWLFYFSSICKYGSFKDSYAMITSLSEFCFIQIQKIYSVGTKEKSDFYELWQQHKQLKTMEMSKI